MKNYSKTLSAPKKKYIYFPIPPDNFNVEPCSEIVTTGISNGLF